MAQVGRLPRLSSFVVDSLAQMGFKQITDRPYDFIGTVKSQADDYGMVGVLSVMPLKIQSDTFVISLDINGEQMVKSRMAKLDEIANLVGYAGVTKEILSIVNRKETNDSSRKNQPGGSQSTNGGSRG